MSWHLVATDDTYPVTITSWVCGSCGRKGTVSQAKREPNPYMFVPLVTERTRPSPCVCGSADVPAEDDEPTDPSARPFP